MEEHLEKFLSLEPGFIGEWTIKFFNKETINNQNSLFINHVDRTIIDMKISDVELFNKIVEKYKTDAESTETKNVTLKENINLHEFFDNIIDEDKHIIVGFISGIKWRDESKTLHSAGSQMIHYTIN
jgi:hypothetical protein